MQDKKEKSKGIIILILLIILAYVVSLYIGKNSCENAGGKFEWFNRNCVPQLIIKE